MHINHKMFRILFIANIFFIASCTKLVEIDEPISSIPTSKVFANDNQAITAMTGVYYNMINTPVVSMGNGAVTVYTGLSSDELNLVDMGNATAAAFHSNNLASSNVIVYTNFWSAAYASLFHVNAVLDGLSKSSAISDSVKNVLTAEAKFTRAFIHFYLVNLYGDIPYANTIDWRESGQARRLPVTQIYQLILNDLIESQAELPADYSAGKGQRIVPNRHTATALLARVYLYQKEWAKAEEQATAVINDGLYDLVPTLSDVFKPNNSEAIWQLQQDNTSFTFNGTKEGETLVPFDGIIPFPPFAVLTSPLLTAFEAGDGRMLAWMKSRDFSGNTLYYPYKYKIGPTQAVANGPYTEYYTALRLAEQYLIRAEARANLNNLEGAIDDLNAVRDRAGVTLLPGTLSEQDVMEAIRHERQIELFAEWGHRWLDLKRWGIAAKELSANKGVTVTENALLYPIPVNELQTNPNLRQNNGY